MACEGSLKLELALEALSVLTPGCLANGSCGAWLTSAMAAASPRAAHARGGHASLLLGQGKHEFRTAWSATDDPPSV
jgi:hypothetical protein